MSIRILKRAAAAALILGFSSSMAHAGLVNCAGPSASNVDTNPGTVVALNCGGAGVISDLNLSVNMTAGHLEDFTVALRHVASGTTVQVKNANNNPFGHQNGPMNVTFDDESLNPYWGAATGPFTGSFRAANLLSAFDGLNVFGAWQLIITDVVIPGEGDALLSWSLQATTVPEPATLGLLGLGIAGFAVARRRKSAAR